MDEIINEFIPVIGFEKLYYVDIEGNVYSTTKSIFLKSKLIRDYLCYTLCKDKTQKNISVHRLIAIHYIPNPNNLPQVNHKNGNKLNNNIDNLEWCTASENANHAYNLGLRKYNPSKERNKQASIVNRSPAFNHREEIRQLHLSGKRMVDIASIYNTTRQTISVILKDSYKY